ELARRLRVSMDELWNMRQCLFMGMVSLNGSHTMENERGEEEELPHTDPRDEMPAIMARDEVALILSRMSADERTLIEVYCLRERHMAEAGQALGIGENGARL